MEKNVVKSILKLKILLIFILLITLTGCSKQSSSAKIPHATKGILNLTDWDFKKDGSVKLDGEWEFYWNELLSPEDFESISKNKKNYQTMPSIWNKQKLDGKLLPRYGYATYRLKIKVDDVNDIFAIKMGETFTAYRIWINGKEIFSCGLVGKSKESSRPKYKPHVTYFKPENKTIDLVLQISNFYYKDGGSINSIEFGLGKNLAEAREKSLILHYFLFGSVLIMGIYHLCLFILSSEKNTTLLFGLFCLIIASRILVTDESYIVNFIPSLSWHIHLKIIVLGYYIGFPVFVSFLYQLYREEFSHLIIRLIQFVGGFSSLFVLIAPAYIYTHTEVFYQLFILTAAIYVFFSVIKAVRRQRRGAKLVIVGFLFLFIATVNDILYAQNVVKITRIQSLLPFGLFVFIILQSYILSKHFSRALIDASIDELTKIFNRRHFIKLFQQEIERTWRTKRPFSILTIDIDNFKVINDSYGHNAGDVVLKMLAKTINNDIRKIDVFGRMGGEEFSLLLPETNSDNAVLVAERLRKKVSSLEIPVSNKIINITISIGLTESRGDSGIEELMKTADKALYKAKNNGRNQVMCL